MWVSLLEEKIENCCVCLCVRWCLGRGCIFGVHGLGVLRYAWCVYVLSVCVSPCIGGCLYARACVCVICTIHGVHVHWGAEEGEKEPHVTDVDRVT